jgi:hypothetical protein
MPEIYTLIDVSDNLTVIALENWRLRAVDGLGMPEVQHFGSRYAQQDGATYLGTRLKPRIVILDWQFVYDTEAELWDAREEILRIAYDFPHGFHLHVMIPNGEERQIDLRFDSGLTMPRDLTQNLIQQPCVIQCIAHDPLFYDPVEDTLLYNHPNIIGQHQITNDGSWNTFPRFLLFGPWDNVKVENETTGEMLDLSAYDIDPNETVTIDLTPGLKTIDSDTDGNLLPYLTTVSDLATWHMAPGLNLIRFHGSATDANSYARLYWYARYIGI